MKLKVGDILVKRTDAPDFFMREDDSPDDEYEVTRITDRSIYLDFTAVKKLVLFLSPGDSVDELEKWVFARFMFKAPPPALNPRYVPQLDAWIKASGSYRLKMR